MFHDDDIDGDFHESLNVNQIRDLIGDDEAHSLFVNFGGLRCYIPSNPEHENMTLLRAISRESLRKLSAQTPGGYLKMPLARSFLVQRYFEQGLGNREIAILLRITEAGVERLIMRLRNAGLLSRAPRPKGRTGPRKRTSSDAA
ncbi:hypothetical protein D4A92_00250 [Rhizobium rosettiformans]|uniref:Uncharacterized protein n=1 Tax=Rhizobium rosettiformans TaxID=1368430 RepID=A0ABX7ERU1_9HYPH|nr:hypothetical protein [Rhizobium rosettiformans]QRF49983.1 hypothetical protein D4A92_00250 [Rhizobium rosettiformans]